MEWVWRGEHYAATRSEYLALKNQLGSESFPSSLPGGPSRTWEELAVEERAKLLKERLKKYTQKVGGGALHGLQDV
jgi:DNA polymerase epsilon subunit 1